MSHHHFTIEKDSTDVTLYIRALDSTDGTILASLAYNTSGLTCYYKRGATGSATALTLATQTATGAHSDGGFVEVDATNMDGTYRLDLSDAIVATGVDRVVIVLQGATNLQPIHIDIELVDAVNVTSGVVQANPVQWNSVSLATTNPLPNAAAGAAGGLPTDSTGKTSFNDLSAANVNAEVLDVLNTDTFAEPGQGTPGATISLAAKIGYLYKAWRNRSTQTASQYTLYNDDATTVDQKATFSDDTTTADRGEVSTGP